MIRGTFIDVKPEMQTRSHRRTKSLPPSCTFFHDEQPAQNEKECMYISLFDRLCNNSTYDDSNESTADCKSPRSESDSMSTACSENERPLSAESVREHVEKLARLISEECSYLRIQSHRLLVVADLKEQGGFPAKRNVAAALCIFVHGLPWTKRAKWRHPLLRSAADALQDLGIDALVVGGNLFVTLPGAGRVQVDFAAAR